jgi:hypothetical protein
VFYYSLFLFTITSRGLAEAFNRLVSPSALIYNLVGQGEKLALDPSPLGLSLWTESLERRKVFLKDHVWGPNSPLPKGAAALILAGPKVPLDPDKTADLIIFLAQGGKLLVLTDPLSPGLDPATFSEIGLTLAKGLVADPETAWAGTDDFFPVSLTFPPSPLKNFSGLRFIVDWFHIFNLS